MTNSSDSLLQIFNILLIIMLSILAVLIIIFIFLKLKTRKRNNRKTKKEEKNVKKEQIQKSVQEVERESIYDFMEFDSVEDNMIMRKNDTKFVMVIKCNGSNFDLASEDEKLAIESGFMQFLNTLSFPIQLYVQTRKFNIEGSILEYKEKLNKLERDALRAKTEYEIIRRNPNATDKQIRNAYFELKRANNVYEYARDVIRNTERLSMNRNVLKKEHYIAVSYSPLAEISSTEKYDKEEIKDKAFSELYTRCQSLIRVLSGCDVNSKILNSTELAELLYVAYNRDQYEVYGIDKILNSNYDQLYVTAPDVLDKKIKRLDEKLEEMAGKKANELVNRVRSDKEKRIESREENVNELVRELTKMILDQNKETIGEADLQKAKALLEEESKEEEAKKNDEKQKEGTRRIAKKRATTTRK